MRLILIFSIFILFFSCDYVDISGIFYSSEVDKRFLEKDSLKNFSPPQVNPEDYTFLVITDTHYYKKQFNYIKEIDSKKEEWGISFIVINGDLVQNGSEESYNLYLEDVRNTDLPIYPVIGNHDIYFNGYEKYKQKIGRTVYDFKIGETLFIFLDTANGTLGGKQKNYLIGKLKNSKTKNKIIFSHYSLFDREVESPTAMTYPEEIYEFFDIFEKYQVTYFVSGHLHFHDYKEIKGTKYIILNNLEKKNNSYLKFYVKNGKISHIVF